VALAELDFSMALEQMEAMADRAEELVAGLVVHPSMEEQQHLGRATMAVAHSAQVLAEDVLAVEAVLEAQGLLCLG